MNKPTQNKLQPHSLVEWMVLIFYIVQKFPSAYVRWTVNVDMLTYRNTNKHVHLQTLGVEECLPSTTQQSPDYNSHPSILTNKQNSYYLD